MSRLHQKIDRSDFDSYSRVLQGTILLAIVFLSVASSVTAQTQNGEFLITYNEGLLSLSVESINLNRVLTAVAKKAGISVTSPKQLEKAITAEFDGVPLEQGLRRILKGSSYALIYAPSGEENGAEIVSGVFVFPEGPKEARRSTRAFRQSLMRSKTAEERKAALIDRYERRLDFLEQRMGVVDEDSPQGKAIKKQILLLERNIEKLLRE